MSLAAQLREKWLFCYKSGLLHEYDTSLNLEKICYQKYLEKVNGILSKKSKAVEVNGCEEVINAIHHITCLLWISY